MHALLALLFALPILALAGGLTVGIVKAVGQQRQIELAQRERIAALERGIDPRTLPPLLGGRDDIVEGLTGDRAQRPTQGLMIAGILTLAIAVGLMIVFRITEEHGHSWALGILPLCIGLGLLLSAWLVRPRNDGNGGPRLPRED